jgi:hypothetical protein
MENMETDQSSMNQSQLQQISANNSKLFNLVIISVLLTAVITGSTVYLWQKSINEKTINILEQKIISLEKQISTIRHNEMMPQPTSTPTKSQVQATKSIQSMKIYSNDEYRFSFGYPKDWILEKKYDGNVVSFSNIAEGHKIDLTVWRVTGFGYCYKYGEKKEIIVGGKKAETADGVGIVNSEMCENSEEYVNRGNTFVLIPTNENDEITPRNKIHIDYEYPLDQINIAKANLDIILSTFKFKD